MTGILSFTVKTSVSQRLQQLDQAALFLAFVWKFLYIIFSGRRFFVAIIIIIIIIDLCNKIVVQ